MSIFRTLLTILLCAGAALAQTATLVGRGSFPRLGGDAAGQLVVAYVEDGNVRVRWSEGDATSWSDPVTLGKGEEPSLTVEPNGAAHLVWHDGATLRHTSAAAGTRLFGPVQSVTELPAGARQPVLSTGPESSLHLAWIAGKDVFYSRSQDNAKSWAAPVNLSQTPGQAAQPVLDVEPDGEVHVAWLDSRSGPGRPDVFYARWRSGAWTQPINVSDTAGTSQRPDLAVGDKGRVSLVWADTSRTSEVWDVYYSRGGDDGFTRPQYFDTPAHSTDPCVAVDRQERVVIAWVDASENSQAPDVFFVQSADAGQTFTRPVNLSRTPGVSRRPDIAVGARQVILVWEETENGQEWIKATRYAFPPKKRQPISSGKF